MNSQKIFVDPEVSRRKFDREIALYNERKIEYYERGWWLMEASFPRVFMVFAASHTPVPVIAFGVHINFSNYDTLPPSVILVKPFSQVPYLKKELPTEFPKRLNSENGIVFPPIAQGHDENQPPFLCIPGVLEYHEHSAHTDDHWLRHRGKGEGTLHYIMNILYQYGVKSIGIQLNFGQMQIRLFNDGNKVSE